MSGPQSATDLALILPENLPPKEKENKGTPRNQGHSGGQRMESPPSAVANLKVLVIDTKKESRRLVTRLLADCNYQVASCATAREALQLLAQARSDSAAQPFGLVLKDHNPPTSNACRFLRKLAQAPSRVPVVGKWVGMCPSALSSLWCSEVSDVNSPLPPPTPQILPSYLRQ